MQVSLNLMTSTEMSETISFTGQPKRGAGWYGPTTGLHTVSIHVQNFRGRISVQAALTASPAAGDWFSVLPGNVAFIEYPRFGYVVASPSTAETSIFGFTFATNAVWVRATMDRSYFLAPASSPWYISSFGLVEAVLLNY